MPREGPRGGTATRAGDEPAAPVTPEQHSLLRSLVLHLAPGAALLAFVLLVAPLVGDWAVFVLFVGIGVVIVPIELGYLLYQGRKKTGRLTLEGVIDYRERLSPRRTALLGAGLALWFMLWLVVSVAFLDELVADALFSWAPETILELAAFEDDEADLGGPLLAVLLAVAFVLNGVVGPVVEELYFRGHLLPRVDRLGARAPLWNAVLFSLYHFWTPWANPGRIVGLLPWIYAVWRTRSLALSIVVHVTINVTFLVLVLAAFL